VRLVRVNLRICLNLSVSEEVIIFTTSACSLRKFLLVSCTLAGLHFTSIAESNFTQHFIIKGQ